MLSPLILKHQLTRILQRLAPRIWPKTALVTGGAVRIGREICLHLAHLGYRVIVHYNTSEPEARLLLQELNRINNLSNGIVRYDLMDEGAEDSLFNHIGFSIDLLVNNAAIFTGDRDHEAIMQINLIAPIHLTHQAVKRRARVINLLDKQSISGGPPASLIVYHLSKFALYKFTDNFTLGRVQGLALGATLYKEGQDLAVYWQVKKEHSSSLESIPDILDEILLNGRPDRVIYVP